MGVSAPLAPYGNHLFVEVCDAQVERGCEVRGIQFQRALEVFDGFLVVAQCCMRQSQIEDRQHPCPECSR